MSEQKLAYKTELTASKREAICFQNMSTNPATRRSILHATADEYAEGATVHGVSYIFNELLPAIDR